ncbi:flavin reductase family protein [Lactovum odontotermitis]
MKSYIADNLTEKEVYKLLSGAIIPRPIAWLTTQNADGLVNAAPFSFFTVVSSDPPIVAISMTAMKDSVRNLLATGEGVIQLVSSNNLENMNQTASTLPADESEVLKFGIPTIDSEMVSVPAIKDAQVRFEVKLYQHLPVGKKSQLMLLEIVNFVFADDLLDSENFHVDAERLNPVARLAGNNYAQLGHIFELKRPK